MYVYDNGTENSPVHIDLKPGDFVRHKLWGWGGILGKCYRKTNRCEVEVENGEFIQTYITSLVKVCDYERR